MPPKKRRASSAPKPPKPPKAPQAWESYSQSFQATQYTHDSLLVIATQQAVEVWPSSQTEDIKDELGAVFEARAQPGDACKPIQLVVYKRGSKARERKGEERKHRSELYTILRSRGLSVT